MAEGILITVVIMFALRGLFLGFVGVVSRVTGIILAYYMAYNYREVTTSFLTSFFAEGSNNSLTLILPIVSSLLLFFGTMIITGLIVSTAFKSLAAIIPALKSFAENKSISGKLLGAITNGTIGAIIVLIGIWGYGFAIGNTIDQTPDNKLQIAANTVGDFLFADLKNNPNLRIQTTTQSSSNNNYSSRSSKTIIEHGSAIIVSEDNPEKTLSINTVREIIDNNLQSDETNAAQLNLLNNSTVEKIMNNPELQSMALEHMQNNPEQIQAILENPKLKEFLEQLNSQ
jgi:hypothetical protein